MTGLLKDKYFLLCLSVAFILLFSSFFMQDQGSDGQVGVVSDVKETSSGFTFEFDGEDFSSKCFVKEKPVSGSVYTIKGSFSDDGSIFFVSSMSLICRR